MIKKLKIDSLKITIDLHYIKFKRQFNTMIKTEVDEDGVIVNYTEFKNQSLKVETDLGVPVYYGLMKYLKFEKVVIMMSAKVLGKDYFNGLDLFDIYGTIKRQGIIDIEFEDFLEFGRVQDCDICLDTYETKDRMNLVLDDYSRCYVEKREGFGISRYRSKNNNGLQCSKRENGILSNIYLKFYNKRLEALSRLKTWEFLISVGLENMLKNEDLDLWRVEFTVKNGKFFKKLFGINNTVSEVFNLSDEKLNEGYQKVINQHFELAGMMRKVDKVKMIKPNDWISVTMFDDEKIGIYLKKLRLSGFSKYKIRDIKNKLEKLYHAKIDLENEATRFVKKDFENMLSVWGLPFV